jgi:hypothetical protein
VHCCNYPGCSKSFHRLDQLKRHRIVHTRAEEKMGRGRGSAVGSESESGITKTETEARDEVIAVTVDLYLGANGLS